jgi:hypothetical protein
MSNQRVCPDNHFQLSACESYKSQALSPSVTSHLRPERVQSPRRKATQAFNESKEEGVNQETNTKVSIDTKTSRQTRWSCAQCCVSISMSTLSDRSTIVAKHLGDFTPSGQRPRPPLCSYTQSIKCLTVL